MKASQRNRISLPVVAVLIGLWMSPLPAQQLMTLKGHNGDINSVVFSPDGKTLASGGSDSKIILWNTKTWKEKKTLKGHTKPVLYIEFSPDGKLLASTGSDNKIQIWDANTWKEHKTLINKDSSLLVSFSPDGKTLAVEDYLIQTNNLVYVIKLLDTHSWKEKLILKDTSDVVVSLSFSPDGKLLAVSGLTSAEINLWSTNTGRIERTLKTPRFSSSVAFSPDGKLFAAALSEGGAAKSMIRVWDVDTWKERQTLKLHNNRFRPSVLFSPDRKTLVADDGGGKIKFWDTTTWKETQTFQHNNHVSCIAFSPDGKILASGGAILSTRLENKKKVGTFSNHTIKLWNVEKK